jgi:hypothetical protein
MAGPAKRNTRATDLDANRTTRELIDEVVPDAAVWLKTPNSMFGGRRPEDLLGKPEEAALRNLVLGMKDGILS